MRHEIKRPSDLDWQAGPLPDPGILSEDTWVLGWMSTVKGLAFVEMVHPEKDSYSGKSRWCDRSGFPVTGHPDVVVTWWAWLKKPVLK